MTVLDLYDHHVRTLSAEEQLELVALIAQKMASAAHAAVAAAAPAKRSLLELEGLGSDLWQGVDAQSYVNGLRDEWDGRP